MEKIMTNQEKICSRAGEYFGNGFHCAEAIVKAVVEGLETGGPGTDGGAEAAAHATAFGGGFARSQAEACGVLSGAFIVIGHFHGRRSPDPDWDLPAQLGGQLRDFFIEKWGTTQCKALVDGFGPEAQMDQCRILVQRLTKEVLNLLAESPKG